MGRRTGAVLLGLAGFLIVVAGLAKWYLYPTLAVAPLDQNSVTTLVGDGVTYFDKATLSEKTDNIVTTLNTIGDVPAAKAYGNNVAIWSQGTATTTSDGTVISALKQRTPFDRTSGEAVNCCNANMDGDPMTFSGLIYKFPFNSQKKTYQFFDNDTRKAWPAVYSGTATLDGLTVYRYVQVIPATLIDTLSVPSKVVGAKPGTMVSVDQYESNRALFYVEPETGVIIKAEQNPDSVLRYQGKDAVVATRGHVEYSPGMVQQNVDTFQPKGKQLHILRVWVPPVCLGIGLICLVVGGLLTFRTRRRHEGEATAPEPEPAATA
jgi:hypothetical protein